MTGKSDNDTAKDLFIKKLNESDMFFNEEPFPANESDKNAHDLCSSVEGAMKYCPKRWETMQKWFAEARRVKETTIYNYSTTLNFGVLPLVKIDHVMR